VDAYHPGAYGGTGTPADWGLARTLARQSQILLAGGLNSKNVREAIHQVQPWGVDVASGVESSPGVMDLGKVADFIQAAHSPNDMSCLRRQASRDTGSSGFPPARE
jgi:phosphoribosylanthranilate isomerase